MEKQAPAYEKIINNLVNQVADLSLVNAQLAAKIEILNDELKSKESKAE